jgi:VRR-NUC domain
MRNPNRKTVNLTPEQALTRAIRDLLWASGVWHFKHWGGPMGEPGIADIIGCYQGRFIAIEIKRPKGIVSPEQKAFLDRVNDAGGRGFVARSIEDVITGLDLGGRIK